MELDRQGERLIYGWRESVDVEPDWVFGLLKSSDVRRFEADRPRKRMIVPQRRLDDDTMLIERLAPKLWRYLSTHEKLLQERRSSIYRGKPPFSVFGVGDYAFARYKVAIAGLYKEPIFSLVGPLDDQPIVFDDTCYFLGFDTYDAALFVATLLNSSPVRALLRSIVFPDAKRPYTKAALMRIDLRKVAERLGFGDCKTIWSSFGYAPRAEVNEEAYEAFRHRLMGLEIERAERQLSLAM
jgi:hypothetical protein